MSVKEIFGKVVSGIKAGCEKSFPYVKKGFMWTFSNFKNFLLVLCAILMIVFFFKYRSAESKYESEKLNHGTEITEYKNKLNESYACSEAYLADANELKEKNAELYDEIKSLKDNPITVTRIKYVTRIDTLRIESEVVKEDSTTYTSAFAYSDDWCKIDGKSSFNLSTMKSGIVFDTLSFDNEMTLDLIEKDDNLYMIGKSTSPYVTMGSIETALVSPEKSKMLKKRFNKPWGVMIGVGGTVTVVDSKVMVVPGVQLTIGYKFLSF